MPFRSSPYIDFDRGFVLTPPMEIIRSTGLRDEQSVDDLLPMFQCRVDVWQFGPAVEMLKLMERQEEQSSVWQHAGYALLATTLSYFEMIGKILNPATNEWRTAKADFTTGFVDVYPGTPLLRAIGDDPDVQLVHEFHDRVRNGLFHLGYTKSHLYIHNWPSKYPQDFETVMQGDERYYFVNPHAMVRSIVDHFPTVIERLHSKTPESSALRDRFRRFIVEYHRGRS